MFSQWRVVSLYKFWAMYSYVSFILFYEKLLRLRNIFSDVVMVHKFVRVIVIVLYHNSEVMEYDLSIISFDWNISIGSQCVGDSKDLRSCSTGRPCPSMLILPKINLIKNVFNHFSWWRVDNLGWISLFIYMRYWLSNSTKVKLYKQSKDNRQESSWFV